MMDYEKPLIQKKVLMDKDLISYAYQVARGMEFMAAKSVSTHHICKVINGIKLQWILNGSVKNQNVDSL